MSETLSAKLIAVDKTKRGAEDADQLLPSAFGIQALEGMAIESAVPYLERSIRNPSIASSISEEFHVKSSLRAILEDSAEQGDIQLYQRLLRLQLYHSSSSGSLFDQLSPACYQNIRFHAMRPSSGERAPTCTISGSSDPARLLPVLAAIEDAAQQTGQDCPAALDLRRFGLLLPRLMRWPGDGGFTAAIWVRLDAWPAPATVDSTIDSAARGVGVPLPGEELLFRFRSINGIGVEMAVRSGGQVVSRVTKEGGRMMHEIEGASGAGRLSVGRWHRVIATYKMTHFGLFHIGAVWIDGLKVAEGSITYPRPSEARLQESYIGGFNGQLASAVVFARGIDDAGANALFAAQPSPSIDLLPPSRSASPLCELPSPPVAALPKVVLEREAAGGTRASGALPGLHVEKPGVLAKSLLAHRQANSSLAGVSSPEAASGAGASTATGKARRKPSSQRSFREVARMLDGRSPIRKSKKLGASESSGTGKAAPSSAVFLDSCAPRRRECSQGATPLPVSWWEDCLVCIDARRCCVAGPDSAHAAQAFGMLHRKSPSRQASVLAVLDYSACGCHAVLLGSSLDWNGDRCLQFSEGGSRVIVRQDIMEAMRPLGGAVGLLPLLAPPSACSVPSMYAAAAVLDRICTEATPTQIKRLFGSQVGDEEVLSGSSAPASKSGLAAPEAEASSAAESSDATEKCFRVELSGKGIPGLQQDRRYDAIISCYNPTEKQDIDQLAARAGSLVVSPSRVGPRRYPTGSLLSCPLEGHGLQRVVSCMASMMKASADVSRQFIGANGPLIVAKLLSGHPWTSRTPQLWLACSKLAASCIGGFAPLSTDDAGNGVIQVVGPSGVPPFGANAARSALQYLLFRFDLWISCDSPHVVRILDDMLVFAAANKRMAALFVPQTSIAAAMALVSRNPSSEPVGSAHECALARILVRLASLGRLLIQHAVGQEDDTRPVAGVLRVSLEEFECRRVFRSRYKASLRSRHDRPAAYYALVGPYLSLLSSSVSIEVKKVVLAMILDLLVLPNELSSIPTGREAAELPVHWQVVFGSLIASQTEDAGTSLHDELLLQVQLIPTPHCFDDKLGRRLLLLGQAAAVWNLLRSGSDTLYQLALLLVSRLYCCCIASAGGAYAEGGSRFPQDSHALFTKRMLHGRQLSIGSVRVLEGILLGTDPSAYLLLASAFDRDVAEQKDGRRATLSNFPRTLRCYPIRSFGLMNVLLDAASVSFVATRALICRDAFCLLVENSSSSTPDFSAKSAKYNRGLVFSQPDWPYHLLLAANACERMCTDSAGTSSADVGAVEGEDSYPSTSPAAAISTAEHEDIAKQQISYANDFASVLHSDLSSDRDKVQAAGSLATLGAGSAVAGVAAIAINSLLGVVSGRVEGGDLLLHYCLRDLAIDFPQSHDTCSWWLIVRVVSKLAYQEWYGLAAVLGWLHQVCPRMEDSSEILRPYVSKVLGLYTYQQSTAGLSLSKAGVRIWIAVLCRVLSSRTLGLSSMQDKMRRSGEAAQASRGLQHRPQWRETVQVVRLAFDCLQALHSGSVGVNYEYSITTEVQEQRVGGDSVSEVFWGHAAIPVLALRLEDCCHEALSALLARSDSITADGWADMESAWHSAQEAAIDSRFASFGQSSKKQARAGSGLSSGGGAAAAGTISDMHEHKDDSWVVVGDFKAKAESSTTKPHAIPISSSRDKAAIPGVHADDEENESAGFRPRSSSVPGLIMPRVDRLRSVSRSSFSSDSPATKHLEAASSEHVGATRSAGFARGVPYDIAGSSPLRRESAADRARRRSGASAALQFSIGSAVGSRRRVVPRFYIEERGMVYRAREAARSLAAAARVLRGGQGEMKSTFSIDSAAAAASRSDDLQLLERIVPLEWVVDVQAATRAPPRRHAGSDRLLGSHHRKGGGVDRDSRRISPYTLQQPSSSLPLRTLEVYLLCHSIEAAIGRLSRTIRPAARDSHLSRARQHFGKLSKSLGQSGLFKQRPSIGVGPAAQVSIQAGLSLAEAACTVRSAANDILQWNDSSPGDTVEKSTRYPSSESKEIAVAVLTLVEGLWTSAVDIFVAIGLGDAVPPVHEHMRTPTAAASIGGASGGKATFDPVEFPSSALEAALSQIATHDGIKPVAALRDRRWRSHTLRMSYYVQRGLSDWAKGLHAATLYEDASKYENEKRRMAPYLDGGSWIESKSGGLTEQEARMLARLPLWANECDTMRTASLGSRPPPSLLWSKMQLPGQLRVARPVMQFGVPSVSWLLPRLQDKAYPAYLGWVGADSPAEGAPIPASRASSADGLLYSALAPPKATHVRSSSRDEESSSVLVSNPMTPKKPYAASGAGADLPVATHAPATALSAQGASESSHAEEESQWQVVKLAHGNFDYGAALYASHCVVVMPGVSVAGRIELTPTRLLFFPEALVCQGSVEDVGGSGECQWVSAADVFQMEYEDGSSAPVGVGALLGLQSPAPSATADAAGGSESLTKAMIGSRPDWVPDAHAYDCMVCGYPFVSSMLSSGKHHCRKCGSVVCQSCSNERRPIPLLGYKEPVRVCDRCADRIDMERMSGANELVPPSAEGSPKKMKSSRRKQKRNLTGSEQAVQDALFAGKLRCMYPRSWQLRNIAYIYSRRYLLQPTAIELLFDSWDSPLFLAFGHAKAKTEFLERLEKVKASAVRQQAETLQLAPSSTSQAFIMPASERLRPVSQPPGSRIQLPAVEAAASLPYAGEYAAVARPRADPKGVLDGPALVDIMKWTTAWRLRAISNFDYLMHLNLAAGRTISDMSQYPVFPWVLADYDSEELDLERPTSQTFRDLSKPVGALNPTRLRRLQERRLAFEDVGAPQFLYGSHYSSMGAVLYYLVRLEPFSSLAMELQSGKFDHADRMFHSIQEAWSNVLQNPSDVKELTPEFYSLPDFLRNSEALPLGTRQDGIQLNDVVLPPWAKGSPVRFVRTMREALESEHVSQKLHHWVDLIFGWKYRGEEALKADNEFYWLTYEGAVNLSEIEDPVEKRSRVSYIMSFGQTPQYLFTAPHQQRMSAAESLNLSWSAAMASAKLTVGRSARYSVVNTTHRAPVHAILLPFGTTRVATIDTRGGLCSHVLSHATERGGLPCVWSSDVDAPRIVVPSYRGGAVCTAPLHTPSAGRQRGSRRSPAGSPTHARRPTYASVGSISLPGSHSSASGAAFGEDEQQVKKVVDPLGFRCYGLPRGSEASFTEARLEYRAAVSAIVPTLLLPDDDTLLVGGDPTGCILGYSIRGNAPIRPQHGLHFYTASARAQGTSIGLTAAETTHALPSWRIPAFHPGVIVTSLALGMNGTRVLVGYSNGSIDVLAVSSACGSLIAESKDPQYQPGYGLDCSSISQSYSRAAKKAAASSLRASTAPATGTHRRSNAADPDSLGVTSLRQDADRAAASGPSYSQVIYSNVVASTGPPIPGRYDGVDVASKGMHAAASASQLAGHGDALLGLGFTSSEQPSDGSMWLGHPIDAYQGQYLRIFSDDEARSTKLGGQAAGTTGASTRRGGSVAASSVLFPYAYHAAAARVLRAPRQERGTRMAAYAQRALAILEAKGGLDLSVPLAATDRRLAAVSTWYRQALAPPGACVMELAAFASAIPTDLLGSIRRDLAARPAGSMPSEHIALRVFNACHYAQQVVIDSIPLFCCNGTTSKGAAMGGGEVLHGWSDTAAQSSCRGIPAAALLGLAGSDPKESLGRDSTGMVGQSFQVTLGVRNLKQLAVHTTVEATEGVLLLGGSSVSGRAGVAGLVDSDATALSGICRPAVAPLECRFEAGPLPTFGGSLSHGGGSLGVPEMGAHLNPVGGPPTFLYPSGAWAFAESRRLLAGGALVPLSAIAAPESDSSEFSVHSVSGASFGDSSDLDESEDPLRLRVTREAIGGSLEVVPQSPISEIVVHAHEITALCCIDAVGLCISGDSSGRVALTGCSDGGMLLPDLVVSIGLLPVQCIDGMDALGGVYAASGRRLACLSLNGNQPSFRDFADPIVVVECLYTEVLVVTVKSAVLVKAGTMETSRELLASTAEPGKPHKSIVSAVRAPGTSSIVLGLSDGTIGLLSFG